MPRTAGKLGFRVPELELPTRTSQSGSRKHFRKIFVLPHSSPISCFCVERLDFGTQMAF